MFKDKIKALRFTIIASLFSVLITGIVFVTLHYMYIGVIFVLNLFTLIINIIAYYSEKSR